MLPLDSQRWDELEHAYGSAGNVPELLRGLESDDPRAALDEIWSALFHQTSVYSASVAAVPHIVRIAQGASEELQVEMLEFVGSVAAWRTSGEIEVDSSIQASYETAIVTGGSLVLKCLATSPHDSNTTTHLLGNLAALKGCVGLGRILEWFVTREYFPICASCTCQLYVWPCKSGLLVAAEDPVVHKETPRTEVEPAPPSEPWNGIDFDCSNAQSWLSDLAKRAGHNDLAESLRYLFGFVVCPACRHRFNLVERLVELA